MLLEIPGFGKRNFDNLVLDFNGTIAIDGEVIQGVRKRLTELSKELKIHVLTGDTHGNAKDQLKGFPCHVHIIPKVNQTIEKGNYIDSLGASSTIAAGNGRNDGILLSKAGLGVALIQREGIYKETLLGSDIIFYSIIDFLDSLLKPGRLKATLRN